MRALVILDGDPVSKRRLKELAVPAELIVCADGGYRHARAADLHVDLVVGDMDTLPASEQANLPPGSLLRDRDPNRTDMQKAVDAAIERGATSLVVTCTLGGRADHALANLSILVRERRVPVTIADDRFDIRRVEGRAVIEAEPGTVVSLIAIGSCLGVTTTGLRWDLQDATLDFSPRGIHNEMRESPASVSVASGDLLLFQGRWVEVHP